MPNCRWFTGSVFLLTLILPLAGNAQPAALKQAKPRLDHYGDPLPEHALLRIGTVRLRPGGKVSALPFTRGGTKLVTINQTTGGHVWDVATGKELFAFGRPRSYPNSFAISPDGSIAAVFEAADRCRIYDTATGRSINDLKGPWEGLEGLCLSPDNKLLATSDYEAEIRVWQVSNGELKQRWQVEKTLWGPSRLTFSPNGKTLAIGSSLGPITLCDVATGKQIHKWDDDDGKREKRYTCFDFSPDNKGLVAVQSPYVDITQKIVLLDIATGKTPRQSLEKDLWCNSIRFAPQGKSFVTGDIEGKICFWDAASLKLQRVISTNHVVIDCLVFSDDGKRLATAGWDNTARIWDVESGKEIHAFAAQPSESPMPRFTADGKSIVSSVPLVWPTSPDGAKFRFWDATTGAATRHVTLDPKTRLARLSVDGHIMAILQENKTIQVRNADTGKEGPALEKMAGVLRWFDLTADGRLLVGQGSASKTQEENSRALHVWNTATGKIVMSEIGKPGYDFFSKFTPDGRHLAVMTYTDADYFNADDPAPKPRKLSLEFWDLRTGRKQTRVGPPFAIGLNAFSPSGRLLALRFREDQPIALWEVATNQMMRLRLESDVVTCIAFSPDGASVAGGTKGGDVFLWNVGWDKPVARIVGHRSGLWAVDFSPDGKRLVSGSNDTTILVWDVARWTDHASRRQAPLGVDGAAKLWIDLGADDSARAYSAIRQFLKFPKEAVDFLRQHLQPVRAAQTDEFVKHIAALDSSRFADRDQVAVQLEKYGVFALPALEKVLDSKPNLEVRRRVELILSKLQDRPWSAKGALQALRALELLEMLGTPDAIALLESLAGGEADAWLTHEAAASLARVRKHGPK